jgi:hypothetical protein
MNMLFVRSFLCIFKALYVAMAQRLVIVDRNLPLVVRFFSLEHAICEVFSCLYLAMAQRLVIVNKNLLLVAWFSKLYHCILNLGLQN